jgi:YebC/PmpR family DNA-binding regulatory protein
MAGHSQFANIKHKKERADNKRGKLFTKLAKEILIATKLGGKDINFNPRLRLAIEKAKEANMPKDNIEKAVKKGAGELESETLSEIVYEGYGPFGIAIVIEALTDNRNRTAGEIRYAFSKFNGSLGEINSVMWSFERKGLIVLDKNVEEEQKLFDHILELGAEDLKLDSDLNYMIITSEKDFYEIDKALQYKKEYSELLFIPKNTIDIEPSNIQLVEDMLDFMRSLEDVQSVYHNAKI